MIAHLFMVSKLTRFIPHNTIKNQRKEASQTRKQMARIQNQDTETNNEPFRPDVDVINRHSSRELERSLIRAVATLKPTELRQLINDPFWRGLYSNIMIIAMLKNRTRRWWAHAQRWRQYAPPNATSYLDIMINYHRMWSGFHCDEPWHNSENASIAYFLDRNYEQRLEEADAQFIINRDQDN